MSTAPIVVESLRQLAPSNQFSAALNYAEGCRDAEVLRLLWYSIQKQELKVVQDLCLDQLLCNPATPEDVLLEISFQPAPRAAVLTLSPERLGTWYEDVVQHVLDHLSLDQPTDSITPWLPRYSSATVLRLFDNDLITSEDIQTLLNQNLFAHDWAINDRIYNYRHLNVEQCIQLITTHRIPPQGIQELFFLDDGMMRSLHRLVREKRYPYESSRYLYFVNEAPEHPLYQTILDQLIYPYADRFSRYIGVKARGPEDALDLNDLQTALGTLDLAKTKQEPPSYVNHLLAGVSSQLATLDPETLQKVVELLNHFHGWTETRLAQLFFNPHSTLDKLFDRTLSVPDRVCAFHRTYTKIGSRLAALDDEHLLQLYRLFQAYAEVGRKSRIAERLTDLIDKLTEQLIAQQHVFSWTLLEPLIKATRRKSSRHIWKILIEQPAVPLKMLKRWSNASNTWFSSTAQKVLADRMKMCSESMN